jgi:hypothetical protein
MAGFDDILKSVQWQQSIQKSLGLSSQLSEMFKAQESIAKNLSGLSMATELAKSMQKHHRMFENTTLSAIEAMTKGLSLQAKFAIPQTTLDAISSISRQHEQLFGGIRAMTEALKIQSPAIAQINNLNFALSGISGQIAAIAAQQRNWSIIDDFEEVTEQAIEFSESLTEEVTEEHKKQFEILIAKLIDFFNKHKQKGIYTFRLLEVLLVFYSYYSIFSAKPELATKVDIRQINLNQDTIIHYINLVNEQLKVVKEYRITNRECEVKLKPKSKTLTLCKLPKDFELTVLQVNHKWVLVSYFDPKDNLPQTGWIMKKYLDKPE